MYVVTDRERETLKNSRMSIKSPFPLENGQCGQFFRHRYVWFFLDRQCSLLVKQSGKERATYYVIYSSLIPQFHLHIFVATTQIQHASTSTEALSEKCQNYSNTSTFISKTQQSDSTFKNYHDPTTTDRKNPMEYWKHQCSNNKRYWK